MDGIQPYAAGPPRPHSPHTLTLTPTATPAKSPSDYLRALRRRIWLVLVIGVPLSILGAVWTVHQPSIYRATAQIVIEPPQFDPVLSTLVSNIVSPRDAEAAEKYIPNRIAMLKSKVLADQVFINDPTLAPTGLAGQEAADELIANLQARQIQGTNQVIVSLEGTDPARTVKQLSLLLELLRKQARDEVFQKNVDSKDGAQASLKQLEGESRMLNEKIYEMLRKHADTIGPEGKNIKQAQFEMLGSLLMQKHARLGELQQQAWMAQSFPSLRGQAESSAREGQIAELERLREELTGRMRQYQRTIRYFDTDPSVKFTAEKLTRVMDRLTRLRSAPAATNATDPYEMLVENMRAEIHSDEENVKKVLAEMQESMPTHQKFLDLMDEYRQKVDRIATMQTKISEFDIVAQSQKDPISLPPSIPEPTVPVRPRRPMNIAILVVLSFGLGIGLVCLLEHLDHSVKVPEHLAAGSDAAAVRGRSPDPADGDDPPGRPSLDTWRARVDRGRRLPQPPRQPAGCRRQARADRDAAGHQRQGGRGQEHDRPEPGRHLRPRRRAHSADGRRPPPAQPGRRLPARRWARLSAWWTCSAATCPGSGRSSGPTSPTSTSCRPATPARSRSRSSAPSSSGN